MNIYEILGEVGLGIRNIRLDFETDPYLGCRNNFSTFTSLTDRHLGELKELWMNV